MNDIQQLVKTLEAGSYNAAPGSLTQGAALQEEDLSPVMYNLCAEDLDMIQHELTSKDAKGTLIQFNRQLSRGTFGGSAQFEKGIGRTNQGKYSRITVPMCYYSIISEVSVAAQKVAAFDGVSADDREQQNAEHIILDDNEFDILRGQSDFSNAGVFDGNPMAVAEMPNMVGIDQQVRQADTLSNARDLMWSEYGANQSVIRPVNGALSQNVISDASVSVRMNHSKADVLMADPISLEEYNKIAFAKERIVLAGSAQEATGASLRRQWTATGQVELKASRYLAGKTQPAESYAGGPAAPGALTPSVSGTSAVIPSGTYVYYATACNVNGESAPSPVASQAVTLGEQVNLAIPAVSGAAWFNVYRSEAGGNAYSAKFIGRIKATAAGATFVDLGNFAPGSVTAMLLEKKTFSLFQLAPLTRLKLPQAALTIPTATYRFVTLAAHEPKKNAMMTNVKGQL